ncbi:MAG: hypothetical protein LBT47_00400 [Deltaproteobacteria bacterium]|jgi:hypothetical protein|nr:hypothetical protein [Deltaproteobacteria bacterium]
MGEGKLPPEGIYLETKKSTIGTGSTAKVTEYRNFWATLKIGEEFIEMVLLDDSFSPTSLREKFPIDVVTGSNWLFVEQGEKKYRLLRPRLDLLLAPPAPKPKPSASPKATTKKSTPAAKKNGWWNK